MTSTIRIGEVLRYARPYSAIPAEVDGLPNYFHRVAVAGMTLPLLESGINPIQAPSKGSPVPAILISSSPHKVGSEGTPWQDFFRPDYGHIRYFGDNRHPGGDPAATRGNVVLLQQFELHGSPDVETRQRATPLIFFRRVRIDGRAKGNIQFHGYGIVERAERIVQVDTATQQTFVNYVFDFAVFSAADENEEFDWSWISARRDPKRSASELLSLAPAAWRRWVLGGRSVIETCRRRVSRLMIIAASERKLKAGSDEGKVLSFIYNYYAGRKGRFEALAAYMAQRILTSAGATYVPGWITPASGDGGADFVGRIDLGTDMSRVKLVVLGQAKCERLDAPTGGNHIARTVARLRRGWLGVYVTTSYFSEAVQREVIEDQYPIVLVDGKRLAAEIVAIIHERGESDPTALLDEIDATYGGAIARRSPEEILLM
jgi:hypothetical protein